MALTGLLQRLNSMGYKNWIKAGHCLLLLKGSLQEFVVSEMKSFHRELRSKIPAALQNSSCQCKATGKTFHPGCPVCAEWKRLILNHHMNRNGEIHWGNCNPSLWPTNYWEVAKAYMPRGHADKRGPELCDASAILNLINACDRFRRFDNSKVRAVIKCRNDLMHSSDMSVSANWLNDFGNKLQNLIAEFKHVPKIKDESGKILQVLSSDWFVEDCDRYETDGLPSREETTSLSVYEVEKQLIQQLLEETYFQIEDKNTWTQQDNDTLQTIKKFLSDNEDLHSDFKADIVRFESLYSHLTFAEGCSL
ncbi:Hypothetical predicted protein [Pelobates cultripes]|uniref:Uncharacterized protein n=2 Tax=Pelobates cultripes TaxID=61616 RepID=A0AAD1QYL0_PELCU|nr:Hypothetical predicted protein [Pelobates cultripes]